MAPENPGRLGENREAEKPKADLGKLKANRDQRDIVVEESKRDQEAQRNGEKVIYRDNALKLGKFKTKSKPPKMEEGYSYRAVGGVDATSFVESKISTQDLLKMSDWAEKFAALYLEGDKIVTNIETLKSEETQSAILDIIIHIGEVKDKVKKGTFNLEEFKEDMKKHGDELVYGNQGAFNILLAMHRADASVRNKNAKNVIYDLRVGDKKLSQAFRYTELRRKFEVKPVQDLHEKMAEAEEKLDKSKAAQKTLEAIFDRKAFDKNVEEFLKGNYLKEVCSDCYIAREKIKGTYQGGIVVNDAKCVIHRGTDEYFMYSSGGKTGVIEIKVIKEIGPNNYKLETVEEILTGDLSSEESKKALAQHITDAMKKHKGGKSEKKVLDKKAEKDKFIGDLGQSLDALSADYSKKYGFEVKFNKVVEKNGDVVFTAKVKNKSGLERSFYARVLLREGSPKLSLSPVPVVGDEFYDMRGGLDALKAKMDFKLDGMYGFDKDKSEGEAETQKKNFLTELKIFFSGNYLGSSVIIDHKADGTYRGQVKVEGSMCSLQIGNERCFVYPDVVSRTIELKVIKEIRPNQFALETFKKISVDNLMKNIEGRELDDVASRGFADKLKSTLDVLRGKTT